MTSTTKGDTKEAWRRPGLYDPAVVAAEEAQAAGAAWDAFIEAHPTAADEQTPEYKAAKERSVKADGAFADAPITSVAGALAKLRALGKDIVEDGAPPSWELRHLHTLTAFLEGFAGAPVVDDPAVIAGRENAEAEAAFNAIDDALVNTPEYEAAEKRMSAANEAFADAPITSAAGALANMREVVALEGGPDRSSPKFLAPRHFDNVVAFLEMGADAPQAAVAKPSPPDVTLVVDDPAILAGIAAEEALAAFSVIADAVRTVEDEETPEWQAADNARATAEQDFADAPVASLAGALVKLRALFKDLVEDHAAPYTTGHVETVLAFLEAVAGGKVAPIGDHPDAELIACVAEFYRAYEKTNAATEAWHTRQAKADAMPDCPEDKAPFDDKAAHNRWRAFMKAQGVWKLSDKANAAGRALGKAANRVFAVPARTYPGALEKVKIAYIATGDGDGTYTGDADLYAYQDFENPWMANAIADLERLGGAS